MNRKIYENLKFVRNTTFRNPLPDCISCMPTNWKPCKEPETSHESQNIWDLSEHSIMTGYVMNNATLSWRHSTYIYKLPPVSDALHYTFISQFHIYYNGKDIVEYLDHIYQLRVHVYNSPTVRYLVPDLKYCNGMMLADIDIREMSMLLSACARFVQSMCKICCIDENLAHENVVSSVSKLLRELLFNAATVYRGMENHFSDFSIYSFESLTNIQKMLNSSDTKLQSSALELLHDIGRLFDGCYRVCMMLSEAVPVDDEIVYYSKPVTHKGNIKLEYAISTKQIDLARQHYKLHRPSRNN